MIVSIGTILKDADGREYSLDERIGIGGFGEVFKSHRIDDNETFAIKTMLLSFTNQDDILSFQNEIKSVQSLGSDGVIDYIYSHDGNTYPEFPPYIIMEYAKDGTLRDLLDSRKDRTEVFENDEIIDIFKKLAIGMKNVNAKLVHRDIKPENILISENTMKISDFGLSKIAIESTRSNSFKGAGTPLYMAPEAWDYSKNTIQMDMYSMGLVFYEIATLQYAYASFPSSYDEAKEMHMYKTIVKPSSINRFLSTTIDSIICRMTEKRASQRFKNWDEIIEILDKKEAITGDSFWNQVINSAIDSKTADYFKKTEIENEAKRKRQQEEDFINSVKKQFKLELLPLLEHYVDKVNENYAGHDKMSIKSIKNNRGIDTAFAYLIESGNGKRVEIDMKVVIENSYQKDAYYTDYYDFQRKTKKAPYTPLYRNKKIQLIGEIKNGLNLGYNLLLVESDDLFGDWIIMKNYNNFSYTVPGKERKEPFSFSLWELPEEIEKVQCTHLYRSEFWAYNEKSFMELINYLITV